MCVFFYSSLSWFFVVVVAHFVLLFDRSLTEPGDC